MFFYVFFALAAQIYKDYKIQNHITEFESRIDELAAIAKQKPSDILYFSSVEYKDRYAKENLNLLNPGERLIVIPQEDQNVVVGAQEKPALASRDVLAFSNPVQWWEYFFGDTLSVAPSGGASESHVPQKKS